MSSLCIVLVSRREASKKKTAPVLERRALQNMSKNQLAEVTARLWRGLTGTAALWALIILIIGSIPMAISKRDKLVENMPQLAPAFRLIGLPVNIRGLTFAELTTRIMDDNGKKILMVEGMIASVSATKTSVPPMLISLRGKDGREIYHWTAQAEQNQLEPGKSLRFSTRLASPPDNAQIARVNFTNAENIVLR